MFEIERKFLVPQAPEWISRLPQRVIEQVYLLRWPFEIRFRLTQHKSLRQCQLTVKMGSAPYRVELEVPFPLRWFQILLRLWNIKPLRKRRTVAHVQNCRIEIDFYDDLDLIVAEVEFPNRQSAADFTPPEWFGDEVTGIREYTNAYLFRRLT